MILFLWLLALFGGTASQTCRPLACLESGTCYQGALNSTSSGVQYAAFQGIRYAEGPIGKLRFKPPQPLTENGTIDVSQESTVMCLQQDGTGQEDCLLLNIYVPEKIFNDESGTKYPVMFWIYGGGYVIGDGTFFTYGPQPLMDKEEVILVTVNYRLGPFGFLSLGIDEAQGNSGLLDQNLALQWVQQNIGQFKGDPNMVTIFGESAGSLSVALQVVSPMSRGLFQRAIMESGVVLGPTWHFIPPEEASSSGTGMAANLGCTSIEDYLECLQSKDVTEILEGGVDGSRWMPTIDPTFLPERPIDILEKGDFDHSIEVILGSNAAEGLLWVSNSTDFEGCRKNFDTCGPISLYWLKESEVTEQSTDQARRTVEYYIGSVDNYDFEHIEGIIDMYTDGFVLYGYYNFADYLIKNGVTVYQYLFSYVGHFTNSNGKGVIAADHGDEVLYLWNYQDAPISGDDITVKNIMTSAWTNFAKIGDPTPPGSDFSWTPLGNVSYNNFWNISGPNPAMEHNEYIQERMEAWKYILDEVPTTTEPTTSEPTTSEPTTSEPSTSEPTTSEPTTSEPSTTEKSTALSNQPLGIFLLCYFCVLYHIK